MASIIPFLDRLHSKGLWMADVFIFGSTYIDWKNNIKKTVNVKAYVFTRIRHVTPETNLHENYIRGAQKISNKSYFFFLIKIWFRYQQLFIPNQTSQHSCSSFVGRVLFKLYLLGTVKNGLKTIRIAVFSNIFSDPYKSSRYHRT